MDVEPGLCRTWPEIPKTCFLSTRLIRSVRFFSEFTVEIDKDHDDIIKLDLMKSLGFVCYNDEEGANSIAKVACGGE